MADDIVGVLNQTGTGTVSVDASKLTNLEAQVVYRQRIALGDDGNPNFVAKVDSGGALAVSEGVSREILNELRAIRIGIGMLINVDLAAFID